MTRDELPGDVLREFRNDLGLTRKDFGRETGGSTPNGDVKAWGADKVANLELGKVKRFTEQDYEDWRYTWEGEYPDNPEWFEKWDQRMCAAMAWQDAVLKAEKGILAEQTDTEDVSQTVEEGADDAEEEEPEGVDKEDGEMEPERVAKKSPSCLDRLILPVSLPAVLVFIIICALIATLLIPNLSSFLAPLLTRIPNLPITPVVIASPTSVPTTSTTEVEPADTIKPASTPTTAARKLPPGVLFEDDFTDVLDPQWEVVKGDWRTANGELTTISRDEEWSVMLVGDDEWTDYAVELDLNTNNDVYSSFQVLVRARDWDNGMAFWTVDYREPKWFSQEGGESTLLVEGKRPNDQSQKLRVEVKGDMYTAYINGVKWISINDPTFSKGKVGVAMYCDSRSNCNVVDNFKVIALD